MSETTAIILAAGRGTRMGPRGELAPKGLFRFNGGRTLVEESVATLKARGIGRVVIVTGHLAEAYEAEAAGWDSSVELVYNPLYAERGSLWSMLVGMERAEGPCLILESDFVYEPRAIDRAMRDESWLMLSGPTGAGDEVYVWTKPTDGRLLDMSKKRDHRADAHAGELVGVLYLTASDADLMRAVGAGMMETQPRIDYEGGLVRLAAQRPIDCPRIDDLAWAEIDDEAMFERAEATVYPRILAARAARAAG